VNRQAVPLKAERAEGTRREPAIVIVVVARGNSSLYRYTMGTFESEPTVEVILDRRYEERRRRAIAPAVERRQHDRRDPQRVDLLQTQGWLIIRGRPDARPST
jgi:hypothetical protein